MRGRGGSRDSEAEGRLSILQPDHEAPCPPAAASSFTQHQINPQNRAALGLCVYQRELMSFSLHLIHPPWCTARPGRTSDEPTHISSSWFIYKVLFLSSAALEHTYPNPSCMVHLKSSHNTAYHSWVNNGAWWVDGLTNSSLNAVLSW